MIPRLLLLLALAAPLTFVVSGEVAAQPAAPLADALQALAQRRGVQLVYAADLVAGRATTCPASVRNSRQSVSAVLACVLDGTGLEARRLPSGSLALYRASAPTPRPNTVRPNPVASPARTAPQPVTRTLSGFVTDASTGEALIGAAVYARDFGRGTTTNAYGFFSLTLPQGDVQTTVSYVGYQTLRQSVALGSDVRLDLALAPDTSGLAEVVVEASDALPARVSPSVVLTGEDVQALPALLGEADLLKALQLQPGVGGGAEGSAGLQVRGGTPDQTLLLLDGTPVYNAAHLFGFLSVFNADAVKHVELFKGGIPARYGGRLSSVVDVRVREGNRQERRSHARVGLLSSGVLTEGPVGASGSYLVAGRRTYVDLLAAPILAATGGIEGVTPSAFFHDLNVKANAALGPRDRVFASVYAGRDRFRATGTDDAGQEFDGGLSWGNVTGTARWTRAAGRAFVTTTATASDYRFRAGQRNVRDGEALGAEYRSGIRDFALQSDAEWAATPSQTVRFGIAATRHDYAPGAFDYNPAGTAADTLLGARPQGAWEGAVYAEDEVRLGRAAVSAGLRASAYTTEGTTRATLEPRLGARLELGRGLAARAALDRTAQYLHLLTTAGGLGLPADLWVPATARVGPQRAWQVSGGVEGTTGRARWSLDAYAKQMDGLVAYRDDNALLRADADWQDLVVTGTGRSAGVEAALAVAGAWGALQAGYTLSRTDRQFDAIDGGARFPFRYDRTHNLTVSGRRQLSRRFDVSAIAVYRTGQAVTLPTAVYFAPTPGVDLTDRPIGGTGVTSGQVRAYGRRNGFRLPAYVRLDVGVDWHFRRGPRPHALSLQVYNALNRVNPFYVETTVETDPETGARRTVLVGKSLFPILPSISYEFSF